MLEIIIQSIREPDNRSRPDAPLTLLAQTPNELRAVLAVSELLESSLFKCVRSTFFVLFTFENDLKEAIMRHVLVNDKQLSTYGLDKANKSSQTIQVVLIQVLLGISKLFSVSKIDHSDRKVVSTRAHLDHLCYVPDIDSRSLSLALVNTLVDQQNRTADKSEVLLCFKVSKDLFQLGQESACHFVSQSVTVLHE